MPRWLKHNGTQEKTFPCSVFHARFLFLCNSICCECSNTQKPENWNSYLWLLSKLSCSLKNSKNTCKSGLKYCAYRKMRFELSSVYCVCVSVMLIKCDKYSPWCWWVQFGSRGCYHPYSFKCYDIFYRWCGWSTPQRIWPSCYITTINSEERLRRMNVMRKVVCRILLLLYNPLWKLFITIYTSWIKQNTLLSSHLVFLLLVSI